MYEKWIENLAEVELFQDMEKEELKDVLSCLQPNIKTYKKKDIITLEKEKIKAFGIVLEGEVLVGKETLAGDRVIMSRLETGDLFGEVAAFASDCWLATVIAETNCTVLFFPTNQIIGVCSNACGGHRKLVQNMLQIVAKKALVLNRKVEMLSLKSIRKKIVTYLLQQYKMKKNATFDIPLKRNELAEFLLVSRPSLSRELIHMQKEGLIDFYRNTFKILDLEGLEDCL